MGGHLTLKGKKVKTSDIIERLIRRADYYDTFGRTDDGDILREAAAALAEARNEQVLRNLKNDILRGM